MIPTEIVYEDRNKQRASLVKQKQDLEHELEFVELQLQKMNLEDLVHLMVSSNKEAKITTKNYAGPNYKGTNGDRVFVIHDSSSGSTTIRLNEVAGEEAPN